MREFKKYLSSALIKKVTEEGYDDFIEITTLYPLSEVKKNGKLLLYLLKVGMTPIDLDGLLGIKVSTIENRILEFLKEKDECGEDTYEDYKFIFENIKSFKFFNMYKRFLNFDSDDVSFRKKEEISIKTFDSLMGKMNTAGAKRYKDEFLLKKQKRIEEERKARNDIGTLGAQRRKKRVYGAVVIHLA